MFTSIIWRVSFLVLLLSIQRNRISALPLMNATNVPLMIPANETFRMENSTVITTALPEVSSEFPRIMDALQPIHHETSSEDLSLNSAANHAITIDHQNAVLRVGESLALIVTNSIVRPLTFLNNLVSSAASSLPSIMAANGAALGTAIAAPIQLGTLAANAAISGITGTLVSIPISLVSGGTAQLVGLIGTGRQIWHNTIGNPNSTLWRNGELWLQPLAVVAGSNSMLAGVGMNALGSSFKSLGQGLERFGSSVTGMGQNAQQLGSVMVGWSNDGQPIMAPVINNTQTNQLSIDMSQAHSLNMTVYANVDLEKVMAQFPNNKTTVNDAQYETKTTTTSAPFTTSSNDHRTTTPEPFAKQMNSSSNLDSIISIITNTSQITN